MRSYAIANIKGGSGKTTVAVNLAAGLALSGRRVVLFDLDPQGSTTFHLMARSSNGNLADAMANEKKLDDVLSPTLVSGLRVGPGSRLLAPFDNGTHPTKERISNLLHQVSPDTDYVLLDTPPTWGSLLIASLSCVDSVLVPVTTRELDTQILGLLMDVIDQVQRHRNPRLRISGIIPNRLVRTKLSAKSEEFLQKGYADLLLPGVRENARIAEAGGYHAPVQITAPSSPGAEDFGTLTRAFLEREECQRMAV
jgi:chromosome partitioning protein